MSNKNWVVLLLKEEEEDDYSETVVSVCHEWTCTIKTACRGSMIRDLQLQTGSSPMAGEFQATTKSGSQWQLTL